MDFSKINHFSPSSKLAPKLTEKRKRLEEATAAAAAANTKAKKLKIGSEEESQEAEQVGNVHSVIEECEFGYIP